MKKIVLPLAILTVGLSGCVIDAGSDGWSHEGSLEERTRLAIEACGAGNVAEVDGTGFQCKTEPK